MDKKDIDSNRQKQMMREIENVNGAITSRLSHEFRTPLTSIMGFAELIIDDPEMATMTRQKFARIILTESERLSSLINNLLDISLLERGGARAELLSEDIIAPMEFIAQRLRETALAKELDVIKEFEANEVEAVVDLQHFQQIVFQLLSNAIKFTSPGGHIWIGARLTERSAEAWIRDSGVGIPTSDLPFIFEKFYRVRRHGEEIPGAGLGLAIVKHLVELQGGSVTVRSQENIGSTFSVRFPRPSRRSIAA